MIRRSGTSSSSIGAANSDGSDCSGRGSCVKTANSDKSNKSSSSPTSSPTKTRGGGAAAAAMRKSGGGETETATWGSTIRKWLVPVEKKKNGEENALANNNNKGNGESDDNSSGKVGGGGGGARAHPGVTETRGDGALVVVSLGEEQDTGEAKSKQTTTTTAAAMGEIIAPRRGRGRPKKGNDERSNNSNEEEEGEEEEEEEEEPVVRVTRSRVSINQQQQSLLEGVKENNNNSGDEYGDDSDFISVASARKKRQSSSSQPPPTYSSSKKKRVLVMKKKIPAEDLDEQVLSSIIKQHPSPPPGAERLLSIRFKVAELSGRKGDEEEEEEEITFSSGPKRRGRPRKYIRDDGDDEDDNGSSDNSDNNSGLSDDGDDNKKKRRSTGSNKKSQSKSGGGGRGRSNNNNSKKSSNSARRPKGATATTCNIKRAAFRQTSSGFNSGGEGDDDNDDGDDNRRQQQQRRKSNNTPSAAASSSSRRRDTEGGGEDGETIITLGEDGQPLALPKELQNRPPTVKKNARDEVSEDAVLQVRIGEDEEDMYTVPNNIDTAGHKRLKHHIETLEHREEEVASWNRNEKEANAFLARTSQRRVIRLDAGEVTTPPQAGGAAAGGAVAAAAPSSPSKSKSGSSSNDKKSGSEGSSSSSSSAHNKVGESTVFRDFQLPSDRLISYYRLGEPVVMFNEKGERIITNANEGDKKKPKRKSKSCSGDLSDTANGDDDDQQQQQQQQQKRLAMEEEDTFLLPHFPNLPLGSTYVPMPAVARDCSSPTFVHKFIKRQWTGDVLKKMLRNNRFHLLRKKNEVKTEGEEECAAAAAAGDAAATAVVSSSSSAALTSTATSAVSFTSSSLSYLNAFDIDDICWSYDLELEDLQVFEALNKKYNLTEDEFELAMHDLDRYCFHTMCRLVLVYCPEPPPLEFLGLPSHLREARGLDSQAAISIPALPPPPPPLFASSFSSSSHAALSSTPGHSASSFSTFYIPPSSLSGFDGSKSAKKSKKKANKDGDNNNTNNELASEKKQRRKKKTEDGNDSIPAPPAPGTNQLFFGKDAVKRNGEPSFQIISPSHNNSRDKTDFNHLFQHSNGAAHKSAFSDVAKQSNNSESNNNNDHEDEVVCQVCRDGHPEEGNEIIICDRCQIAVHQACYGVIDIPSDEWFCKPCSTDQRSPKKCALCHQGGGPMTSIDENDENGSGWVHTVCALWVPEVTFANAEELDLARGIQKAIKTRKGLICCVCKQGGGCIQCSDRRCRTAFHVTCAMQNLFWKWKDVRGAPTFSGLCDSHRPKKKPAAAAAEENGEENNNNNNGSTAPSNNKRRRTTTTTTTESPQKKKIEEGKDDDDNDEPMESARIPVRGKRYGLEKSFASAALVSAVKPEEGRIVLSADNPLSPVKSAAEKKKRRSTKGDNNKEDEESDRHQQHQQHHHSLFQHSHIHHHQVHDEQQHSLSSSSFPVISTIIGSTNNNNLTENNNNNDTSISENQLDLSALVGDDGFVQEDLDLTRAVCAVCWTDDLEEGELLVCEGHGCNLAVHQSCYGVPEIPEGSWYCDSCVAGDVRRKCELCPVLGGALKEARLSKKNNEGKQERKWVHVMCVLWIDELQFDDVEHMKNCDISRMHPDRKRLRCCICKQGGGCVQCVFANCTSSFHVSCAMWMRRAFSYDEHHVTFCWRHTPRLHWGENYFTQFTEITKHEVLDTCMPSKEEFAEELSYFLPKYPSACLSSLVSHYVKRRESTPDLSFLSHRLNNAIATWFAPQEAPFGHFTDKFKPPERNEKFFQQLLLVLSEEAINNNPSAATLLATSTVGGGAAAAAAAAAFMSGGGKDGSKDRSNSPVPSSRPLSQKELARRQKAIDALVNHRVFLEKMRMLCEMIRKREKLKKQKVRSDFDILLAEIELDLLQRPPIPSSNNNNNNNSNVDAMVIE